MFKSDAWIEPLLELCHVVRRTARAQVAEALDDGTLARLGEALREGAGDITYALDARTEVAVDTWLDTHARAGPLSLLTEDKGWRHRGPDGHGGVRELPGFDHGGPRIAVDPIDGTRNLMADLRSAWVIAALAPPGADEPRLADASLGIVSEIPDSRAARFRELVGLARSGCRMREIALASGRILVERALVADAAAHVDHGYFTFFRYLPDQRPLIARVEAAFFERLAAEEGADLRTCYDDQYISSGGQLALVALGTYRMAVDVRGLVARKRGVAAITTKPYDVAGAIVCARAAGAIVTAPDGAPLDFPIDCITAADFAAFANAATAERVGRHLREALKTLDA